MVAFPDDLQLQKCRDPDERRRLLAGIFGHHMKRLRSMVDLRLDPQVRGRIGSAEVLQEALEEATKRIDDYVRSPRIPLFLWLHSITAQKLRDIHRGRQGTGRHDTRREICLQFTTLPEASLEALETEFLARCPTPIPSGRQAEARARLRRALDGMSPLDREILAFKLFEHLTNAEAALMVGIPEAAAGQRYHGALSSLQQSLSGMQSLS